MSEERELYKLRYQAECIVPILDRIATALERMAPQGSEREQIALRVYCQNTIGADTAFEYADEWIAERNKQRAQAEPDAQPTV